MKATVQIDGKLVPAEFTDCILHTTGEFAGNLDFSVKFTHQVPVQKILHNLRLRLPNKKRLNEVAGYKEIGGGFNITMCTEISPPAENIADSAIPVSADVFWLEESKDFPIVTLRVSPPASAMAEHREPVYQEAMVLKSGRSSLARFLGCYMEFLRNGRECWIGERKWTIGALFLLLLSPGFFLTEGLERFIVILFALPAIWCIGFYRRAHFDKDVDIFEYEKGFLLPMKRMRGALNQILFVEFHTFTSGAGRKKHHHSQLSIQLENKKLILSYGITIPYTWPARRLAVLIGCNVKFTGANSCFDDLGSGRIYEETSEEAFRKLEGIQKIQRTAGA